MLVSSWKAFVAARGQFFRLEELLVNMPDDRERMELPAPTGRITVENMTAMPPGAQIPVLQNINFEVDPGTMVAIIGPSAAGKSSLARVMLGIWPAAAGKVRLDSADVYQWDRELLGPHIGYLPQDVELFDGTIAQNIARFGDIDAEKIVAAAELAGVHDMILRLPEGYDTEIGVSGGVLSGGQRQRIGLARAVYGDPKLVILDEPNSNLDDAGEASLRTAVLALKERGVTVIIVSHRPSILSAVDKILVLQAGKMVTFEDAKDLMDKANKMQQQGSPAVVPTQTVGMKPVG